LIKPEAELVGYFYYCDCYKPDPSRGQLATNWRAKLTADDSANQMISRKNWILVLLVCVLGWMVGSAAVFAHNRTPSQATGYAQSERWNRFKLVELFERILTQDGDPRLTLLSSNNNKELEKGKQKDSRHNQPLLTCIQS
jgi:hypothetical protein